MTLLAGLPDGVVLVLWAIGATAGLALVTALIARAFGRDPGRMALRAVAAAPLVLPFAVAVLFGNLDAWYPLAYGALLLTVLPGCRAGRTLFAGGIAVATVSIAKLHPAPLLLWVAARAIRERGGPQARVLAAAAVTGLAIVAVSLAVGGLGPWQDYIQVVRVGAGAGLVDATERRAGLAARADDGTGRQRAPSGPGRRGACGGSRDRGGGVARP